MIISANDKKTYRYVTLDNGLKVLLIHDEDCQQSAASLAVNVGHFNDPIEHEGLSHLLEHMMFLGTAKYPNPDEYQQFIKRHGGQHNAWSGAEFTNYYFSIDNQYFSQALDRFSQFFITPLLDGQWIAKEVNSVHSEYLLKVNDDSRRLAAVIKETVNPHHPYSQFSVGNETTLSANPQYLESLLKTFFETNYSSDKMTLVLLSNASLSTLEQEAAQLFGSIAQRDSLTTFPDVPLYTKEQQHVEIHVVPLNDIKKLTLTFPVPIEDINYSCKPFSYIAHLLGHEGKGSLLSCFKMFDLANELTAGTGLSGYNFREFSIEIELTELGMSSIDRIIAMVFQKIRLIEFSGVEAWRYTEQHSIINVAFDFQETLKAIDFVSHLSINMFKYDQQDIIYGDYAMDSFEPDAIHRCLKAMSPENLRIIITNQNDDVTADHKLAKWYETPYQVTPIKPERVNIWANIKKDDALKLPLPNPFVVERLAFTPPQQSQHIPEILFDKKGMRLWHLPQSKFKVPKGHIYTAIDSPAVNADIKSQVLCRLYIELLHDSLMEITFPAEIAGMHYDIYPHASGLTMHVSGYTPKLFLFFEILIGKIKEQDFPQSRFNEIKHQLEKNWLDQRKAKPINRLFKGLSATLQPHQFDYPELLAQLTEIKLSDITHFITRLFNRIHLESYVQGDWPTREVNVFAKSLYQQISAVGQPHNSIPRQVYSLANKQTLLRSFENEHNQSAVIMYFQGQQSTPHQVALWSLASQVFSPLFFAQVRTKLQLGYVSGASYMPINRYPGLMLYVQSSVANSEELIAAMDKLLVELPDEIQALSSTQWQQTCQGMIAQVDIQDRNANHQAIRHWTSICNRDLGFSHREEIIEAINHITPEILIDFVVNTFTCEITDKLIMISHASKDDRLAVQPQYHCIKNIHIFKANTKLLSLLPS